VPIDARARGVAVLAQKGAKTSLRAQSHLTSRVVRVRFPRKRCGTMSISGTLVRRIDETPKGAGS
jgi:hypothetical protein